ncbi:MAG TPA: sulfopyruvate decarboxylase subunit alpha [Thermodesulfovibrionales bacterium]|nr:sulfopyruvate decarboxylase subunit alpha [Thermodesulfovibrionales bacterium]
MYSPEEELITILKKSSVDFTASLPCEKIRTLLEMVGEQFFHVPLTREEEGVGICAGAALAGRHPAMFVQSSGIGNMLNALLSLTQFYELPLAIFVSQRGIYKEKIAAQFPMGQRLPAILGGAGVACSTISTRDDLIAIAQKLPRVYETNQVHAFLLNPAIWEGSTALRERPLEQRPVVCMLPEERKEVSPPVLTRYGIIEAVATYLSDRAVVCNLGWPSKELYSIRHQGSNFYMLGSMGMASPIGLGISLSCEKEVVVIDGDGSLLMNPGVLATAAHFAPERLTILAIDNSSYGSTGSQETLTGSCVDLELVARGFGIGNTVKVSSPEQLGEAMSSGGCGLKFIHALAVPGNRDVPNIPIDHIVIRDQVIKFLRR